jgi:hypothetical protein
LALILTTDGDLADGVFFLAVVGERFKVFSCGISGVFIELFIILWGIEFLSGVFNLCGMG